MVEKPTFVSEQVYTKYYACTMHAGCGELRLATFLSARSSDPTNPCCRELVVLCPTSRLEYGRAEEEC